MTVRADDIALGSLGKDPINAGAAHKRSDARDFRRRVPVIEVHRALGESTAAIGTRHRPQLVEDVRVVPPPNAMAFGARHCR